MPTAKSKGPTKIAAPVSRKSARLPTKSFINETRTSVSVPGHVKSSKSTVVLDSESEKEEREEGSEEEDEEGADADNMDTDHDKLQDDEQQNGSAPTPKERAPSKTMDPTNSDGEDSDDGDAASPSFGELLRGQEIVDVPPVAIVPTASGRSDTGAVVVAPSKTTVAPPSLSSLGTVLTQALRSDDTELLESCLATTDITTIRNTIERLDGRLAGTFLVNLASRLYRRPGRAGTLMHWVQWILVAHGGALASQPDVLSQLSTLQKVLSERARGLNSLLALKGKLDLLEAQMALRQSMQRHNSKGAGQYSDSEGESDENVIWVENDDNDGEDEEGISQGRKASSRRDRVDDDEGDELPIANGIMGDSDEEEDEADDHEEDENASQSGEESLDEDEVDHDDVDESMGEEDEDSEIETAPPAKMQKTATRFSKRE